MPTVCEIHLSTKKIKKMHEITLSIDGRICIDASIGTPSRLASLYTLYNRLPACSRIRLARVNELTATRVCLDEFFNFFLGLPSKIFI